MPSPARIDLRLLADTASRAAPTDPCPQAEAISTGVFDARLLRTHNFDEVPMEGGHVHTAALVEPDGAELLICRDEPQPSVRFVGDLLHLQKKRRPHAMAPREEVQGDHLAVIVTALVGDHSHGGAVSRRCEGDPGGDGGCRRSPVAAALPRTGYDEWCEVRFDDPPLKLAFQKAGSYQAPEWPDGVPQQDHLFQNLGEAPCSIRGDSLSGSRSRPGRT